MNEGMLHVLAAVGKAAAQKVDGLEDKCRAAMVAVKENGLVTDEDLLFRGAVGGVLCCVSDEERDRITKEIEGLRALNAMVGGVPVDLDRVAPPESPIGLLAIWREVNKD